MLVVAMVVEVGVVELTLLDAVEVFDDVVVVSTWQKLCILFINQPLYIYNSSILEGIDKI